jgi:hypothetical protein
MFAKMLVTALVALCLSSISQHKTQALQAHIQQPQSTRPSKALRIFVEEDFSSAQGLKRELTDWSRRIGVAITFVEKNVEPYDLRILLASELGSGSGSCSSSYSTSSCDASCSVSVRSCNVTVTLHFVSAVALAPDGGLQFTEAGVGNSDREAITPLARKLAKRFSVLPGAKATPSK